MNIKKRRNFDNSLTWPTLGAFFCLFLYGFVDNLKGSTLPPLLSDLGINYSTGGAIQQGAYLGFLIATLFTGILVSWIGHRKVLLIGAACLLIGMLSYSYFSYTTILLISIIIVGLGLGTLDLVGIRLITDFRKVDKAKYLNLSAFFHGLASMIAPIFAGYILSTGNSWRNVYQYAMILVIFFLFYFILMGQLIDIVEERYQKPHLRTIFVSLVKINIWAYYLLILCYEAVEIGFAVWISEFLQRAHGMSAELGVVFLSLFFFFLMTGRFIGSFFVERLGYLKMLLVASVGSSICIVLGVFGPDFMIILLPLTGLFLSVIFPTTTALASKEIKSSDSLQLGLFFTFAGVGGMIGSWVIGVLSDLINIQTGFGSLFILTSTIVIIVSIRLNREKNRLTVE